MQTELAPDYLQLEEAVIHAELAVEPSEIHGVMVGALCHHLKTGEKPDLIDLLPGTDETDPGALESLAEISYRLYRTTMDKLLAEDLEFSLMLPPDDLPVADRTRALAAWCRGYLLGLLYGEGLGADQFPGDSPEIIRDIMKISEATSGGQDEERDEWAFAEVEEYLRVGVQLVFESVYLERASQTPVPAQ